jgi:hypothetical protein|tara:strand:- start:637 stop:1383 length:747 start_codon:yes stop_codon:yes gene_type:complete
MVIGRDVIPVHIINSYIQFPASGGGGASSDFIQIATSASGNYPNSSSGGAVKFGFFQGTTAIGGVFDGSSGLGTASSPTRTTQSVTLATSTIQSAHSSSAFGALTFVIGGYLRGWDDSTTANNSGVSSINWKVESGALVNSSMSNGTSITLTQITSVHPSNNSGTYRDRTPIQDNTAMPSGSIDHTGGIYAFGVSGSASIYVAALQLGGGRGSTTFPATNDTFTLRLSAEGTIGGVAQEVVHDIIVTF